MELAENVYIVTTHTHTQKAETNTHRHSSTHTHAHARTHARVFAQKLPPYIHTHPRCFPLSPVVVMSRPYIYTQIPTLTHLYVNGL